MLEQVKISYRSLIGLILITISPTAILYLPNITYKEAKQDGWISIFIVMFFGFLVTYIITTLGLMYKDKTIIEYSSDILGNFLGKVIGFVLCIYFIYINATVIREFTELLSGPFLPGTAGIIFSVGILLPCIYAIFKGFEVITRVNAIIFPIFMVAIIMIMVVSSSSMDFQKLTPILAEGIEPVLKGSYRQLIWFGETLTLAMVMPYIDSPNKIKKITLLTIFFITLLGICVNISIVTTFGARTETLTYAFLELSRNVHLGNFIERLDSILMIIWVAAVFMKITIFYYCSVLAISQLFHLKRYNIPTIPVGIILILLATYLWKSLPALKYELEYIAILPYTIVQLGIPLILLIVATIKRRFIYEK